MHWPLVPVKYSETPGVSETRRVSETRAGIEKRNYSSPILRMDGVFCAWMGDGPEWGTGQNLLPT
jgi:hypothetical protein